MKEQGVSGRKMEVRREVWAKVQELASSCSSSSSYPIIIIIFKTNSTKFIKNKFLGGHPMQHCGILVP